MNFDITTQKNGYTKISIYEDREMIKTLENEYQQNCMALQNIDLEFGIWFTENRYLGVYGDNNLSLEIAELYCEEYAEDIRNAFENVKTLEEAIDVANKIILGISITILRVINELKAS